MGNSSRNAPSSTSFFVPFSCRWLSSLHWTNVLFRTTYSFILQCTHPPNDVSSENLWMGHDWVVVEVRWVGSEEEKLRCTHLVFSDPCNHLMGQNPWISFWWTYDMDVRFCHCWCYCHKYTFGASPEGWCSQGRDLLHRWYEEHMKWVKLLHFLVFGRVIHLNPQKV